VFIKLLTGLGMVAMFGAMAALVAWIVTRQWVRGAFPSTPLSVVISGWRSVCRLVTTTPRLALAGFAVKLFQSLGRDLQNLVLSPRTDAWSAAGVGIDLVFAAGWAAFAQQIYMRMLAPEATPEERRTRTRIAIIYALAFWAVILELNILGIGIVIQIKGADHGAVVATVGYITYALMVLSALTRPGISTGLPRPLGESIRIIRNNVLGIATTLALAALPLGLIYLVANLTAAFVRMPVALALILEVPLACASSFCYATFEGGIAAFYKRVM